MSTLDTSPTTAQPRRAAGQRLADALAHFARIPHSLIALLARVSVAVTFWLSGQTKIEGLVLGEGGREIARMAGATRASCTARAPRGGPPTTTSRSPTATQ